MDRFLEIFHVLVIAGAVVAFGAVRPLAYSLMEVALFAATLALLVKQAREGRIRFPLPLASVLVLGWIALSLVPLPVSLVNHLQPGRLGIPQAPGGPANAKFWVVLSVYPHATMLGLMKFLAYVCALVLAAYLFDSRRRKSVLVTGLIAVGVLEATYGSFQYLTGFQRIFGTPKVYYREQATGTYINHNHFAGLLEMVAPFALATAFYSYRIWIEERRRGPAGVVSDRQRAALGRFLVYCFLVVVLVVSSFFSQSRAGIVSMLVSIFLVGILAFVKVRRRAWIAGLLFALLVALGYGVWAGLEPVVARFEMLQQAGYLSTEGRLSVWRDAVGIMRDYPWTGSGLGTFGYVYRHYQTVLGRFFFDHAHNDYVEFTCDIGFVGVVLLFLPIIYFVGRMIVSFLRDSRQYRPSVLLGCIGAAVALLLHSILDFNLQIPANALVFSTVLGLGYKAGCLEPRQEGRAAGAVQRSNAVSRPSARVPRNAPV
jgi:O-antigen ligase